MSDAVRHHPPLEDAYLEALEAFLKTSADYLGVEFPLPARETGREIHIRGWI